jgi:hypothetical protein
VGTVSFNFLSLDSLEFQTLLSLALCKNYYSHLYFAVVYHCNFKKEKKILGHIFFDPPLRASLFNKVTIYKACG